MDLSGYTFGKICTGEINLSECQAAQFDYPVLFALGVIQVIASVRFLMRSVTDTGTCAPLLLFDILCATYRQHIKAKFWPHWCFIVICIATAQELKIDRSRFCVFMPLFTLHPCVVYLIMRKSPQLAVRHWLFLFFSLNGPHPVHYCVHCLPVVFISGPFL